MKKIAVFFLLGVIITLLVTYSNHWIFYLQEQRLKKHLAILAPVFNDGGSPYKTSFCTLRPYSKTWVHRVNTIERFKFLSNHFQGFELDVVFDEQRNFLDIRHPPATSIDLSFEKYLQASESKNKFFWLDLKNLTDSNKESVLNCFARLDDQYRIRERVIVESNNIIPLSKIADAGYFTSYYYDRESYNNFIHDKGEASTAIIFNKIDAVSQDVLMYDTLLKRFPLKPRLTWALSIKNYLSDSMFNALDNDHGLLVYLVNVKSSHYR